MKKFFLFLLILSAASVVVGQNKASLEISLYTRYDKHADYTTRYGDRSFTDALKLWGANHGLQFHYWHPIIKGLKAGVGIGYSKLGINKVRATSPRSSNAPGRTIDYTFPSGIKPLVSTNKYYYNNLTLSAGLKYEQGISEKLFLTAAADFGYLYTFSQQYRIPWGSSSIKYKTTNSRLLGFSVNASLGVLKKVRNDRYYVNPSLILPLYQQLNGDEVFRENESVKMTKNLHGAGLSISVGKYF
jgi:hypothetical protein